MKRAKQDTDKDGNVSKSHWFFKLFNSIKEAHEVDFAELELISLFGPVERVQNFTDCIESTPLRHFTTGPVRIQDVLTYEPCYGRVQGFSASTGTLPDIERLVRRLAYTREIVGTIEGETLQASLMKQFPAFERRGTAVYYKSNGHLLVRLITNQYFLEKSTYVSKLSRDENELQRNSKILIEYPFQQLYRIPASATMSVGKRLEDYFTIREESSLYLTHMLHPYKGKFHAKMVRALLNYAMPDDRGRAMDNFAGSGTLLLEATLMGLDSTGVEINPLSVLISNVKAESTQTEPAELKRGISLLLKEVSSALAEYQTVNSGDTLLVQPKFDQRELAARVANLPKTVKATFSSSRLLEEFIVAHQIILKLPVEERVRRFLLLGLSGTISDLARRTSRSFREVFTGRLYWMYLRVYLFDQLNGYLGIKPGGSATYVGDTRDMRTCWSLDGKRVSIPDNSIDAIVNSPPYSTALDYIRNDLPQLTILEMVKSLDQLERDMIGNPNLSYYSNQLIDEIDGDQADFKLLPTEAKTVISSLINSDRKREALRVYKFFKDIYRTILEMRRVLKPGGKAVIIIGNNHYKLDGNYVEVKNDEVIAKIAEDVGLTRDPALPLARKAWEGEEKLEQMPGGIRRHLEKTMSGMIRYETVLVLDKQTE